jgi:pyruvate,water dikinase
MVPGPLILPLSDAHIATLPLVGGKAANLGELIRAGFQVPEGFCVTTAAYELTSASAQLKPLLDAIALAKPDDTAQLARLAAEVRAQLTAIKIPSSIVAAVRNAYRDLVTDEVLAVAVRSSATAEDLPYASFAGQQDTYLNVMGFEQVLDATQRCWASLWTERAVAYRASQGIDPHSVRLAVIVQRMVDAQAAGILFTANPLTGRRRQAVINASVGLGEAVVSGLVNPDHFVVNPPAGDMVERRVGDKRLRTVPRSGGGVEQAAVALPKGSFSLTDEQVIALARLGEQVGALFGASQDIEWAIDGDGRVWLTQARPITTLFPLPADAPSHDETLHVYLSYNVQQGSHKPFTPLGISGTRLLVASILSFAGFPVSNLLEGPSFVKEAALRVYFDVTGALRSSVGRSMLTQMMAQAEAHAAAIFEQLTADPRLSLQSISRIGLIRAAARYFLRLRAVRTLLQTLVFPETAHPRLLQVERALRDAGSTRPDACARDDLEAVENLFMTAIPDLLPAVFPVMMGGLATLELAEKLLGDRATTGELQIILRGLPFNPTTEMTLTLWALAQQIQGDRVLVEQVQATSAEKLAQAYSRGKLPPLLQTGMAELLAVHGHRSVNELDLGAPRWSEAPAYLFGVLASYLALRDPESAPDVLYRGAAREANAMVAELARRASRQNWLRGRLVHFLLNRARALGGLREMPRYLLALMLAQAQSPLRRVGAALVEARVLEAPEDIVFLSLPEVHEALSGQDYRSVVKNRRSLYQQEQKRRHVPLVLLSDGTAPAVEPKHAGAGDELLHGIPASPGIVTARAKVILDPLGAQLARGDILVAPSTDPGWTPLFLLAGGLVVETGGEMSHGAIVAREYGIPAVVGATGAVERIQTGQPITVDGTAGLVHLITESA